jgi:hypothetical protein
MKKIKQQIEKVITGIKNKIGLNGSSAGKQPQVVPVFLKK